MALTIVGKMTEKGITVLDAPEFRKPQINDIAECGGKFWWVCNPDGLGNQDISADFIRVNVMADLMDEADIRLTQDAIARP